ncbi:MAG: glycosyl hydrolase family 39, partial [Steroidobacteraceae bacterium]
DAVRRKLSPNTGTAIDEIGSVLPGIMTPQLLKPIPQSYWNLSGAMWAYVFGNAAVMGIDAVHVSELIDYPAQVASTTLLDWNNGEPNARYWVAKLLRDNFGPGDEIVQPLPPNDEFHGPDPLIQIYAQGFISPQGTRKLLLVNKRSRPIDIVVPGIDGGTQQIVDRTTNASPRIHPIRSNTVHLPELAVAVLILPSSRVQSH